MSTAHNKRRNSLLLYEFLVKKIASSLVESDERSSAIALKLMKQAFKPGTELYKEFRLLRALATTTVSSEAVAASIMNEAKTAARNHDTHKLDSEKTALIHSINRSFRDEFFFEQPIAEYKQYATLQQLVNFWRSPGQADLARLAQYEDSLVQKLTAPPPVEESVASSLSEESPGTNRLLFKIMLKKINEKYSGVLTPSQKQLLKAYAFSSASGDDTVVKKMVEVKDELLQRIDEHLAKSGSDDYITKKLTEVRAEIQASTPAPNDEMLTKFMLFAKLDSELASEED